MDRKALGAIFQKMVARRFGHSGNSGNHPAIHAIMIWPDAILQFLFLRGRTASRTSFGLAILKMDDKLICVTIDSDSKMGLQRIPPTAAHDSASAAATKSAITNEQAAALARTTVNLFRRWQLDDKEACALLGGMAKSTWKRWKGDAIDHPERIDNELRRRMAILMGVHAGLRTLFDDPEHGYAWVRSPNKTINGKTPLNIMMKGEVSNLIEIRDWLYAACQIW